MDSASLDCIHCVDTRLQNTIQSSIEKKLIAHDFNKTNFIYKSYIYFKHFNHTAILIE